VATQGPERTCLGCRKKAPQSQLVRYVAGPGAELLVDYRHKLPGRGCYTCLDSECMALAVRKKLFSRALKIELQSFDFDSLKLHLGEQIVQKIKNLVGMGRKSRQLFHGSGQFELAVRKGTLGPVLFATDLAENSEEKLLRIARKHQLDVYRLFDRDTLGHLTGKNKTGVIAICSGELAESIRTEINRYFSIVGEV